MNNEQNYQFTQKYEAAQTFNIDKKRMFLEHQISISEWFAKDHVTLKTGAMSAENVFLPSQE